MIQGGATTQPTVGWVVAWPLAWLLTYQGSDCQLWQYVYRKYMEAELCREAAELLPTIGYDLRRHKCLQP